MLFRSDDFPQTLCNRRASAAAWARFLAPFDDVLIAPYVQCVVPWRVVRRAPGTRDRVVAALRGAGIDAGTNFPALTTSFPSLFDGQRYAGAEHWGRDVLNLWVTPAYDDRRMGQVAEVIHACLSENTGNRHD